MILSNDINTLRGRRVCIVTSTCTPVSILMLADMGEGALG
jgi:hypothetical protein